MARRRVAGSRLLPRRPVNGGAGPGGDLGRQAHGGAPGVRVLGVVAPVAVAVLEVEPQVLDGLRDQLGQHLGPHVRGQAGRQAHGRAELGRVRRPGFQHLQRLAAPFRGQPGAVPVGGHVDRVHRLPAGRGPG